MATRTISNAGGNYNATGTWVEAAVPTSADDVVATATSGQLTVNVTSAARTVDFTNYTNTLTMNNIWTVSGASLTNTFVSAMTISGGSNINLTGAGAIIVTNGKTIPNMSISNAKTLNDTLNVGNFSIGAGLTLTGTQTINCSGNFTANNTTSLIGTGITLNLTGTGTLTGILGLLKVSINTSGTITIASSGLYLSTSSAILTNELEYVTGTIAGTKRIWFLASGTPTSTYILNMGSSSGWDLWWRWPGNATTTVNGLTLKSDFNFNKMYLWIPTVAQTNSMTWLINGAGALKNGSVIICPWITSNAPVASPLFYNNFTNMKFGSTASHLLSTLECMGLDGSNVVISSQTASTTAYLGVSGTASVINATITDIDASAGPFSTFRGTLTRTTAITNYNTLSGGGVSGGSWTFVQ